MLDPNFDAESIEVICELPVQARESRVESILETLRKGIQRSEELAEGYAFLFPANQNWPEILLEFIQSERECCPAFQFSMRFEPQRGPIWLEISGPGEVKDSLQALLLDQTPVESGE